MSDGQPQQQHHWLGYPTDGPSLAFWDYFLIRSTRCLGSYYNTYLYIITGQPIHLRYMLMPYANVTLQRTISYTYSINVRSMNLNVRGCAQICIHPIMRIYIYICLCRCKYIFIDISNNISMHFCMFWLTTTQISNHNDNKCKLFMLHTMLLCDNYFVHVMRGYISAYLAIVGSKLTHPPSQLLNHLYTFCLRFCFIQ